MDILDFYDVSKDYVAFLQKSEIEKRGFTKVPNMDYGSRKQKFICGTVLKERMSGMDYFVSVSSYKIQKSENILIDIKGDKNPIKGSLRFNYMFPVPKEMLIKKIIDNEQDRGYKDLLSKEFKFVNQNAERIINKAEEVYLKITTAKCSQNLLSNSCDFPLLEQKCLEYCREHNLELPHALPFPEYSTDTGDAHTAEKENPYKLPGGRKR